MKTVRFKQVFAVALVCFMMVAAAGCGAQETPSDGTPAEGYGFTDALGNEVTVASHERVVALMGSFAETWQLAGGTLVGATDDAFEDRGFELLGEVAPVGMYTAPNLEAIIALEPDLVLLSSETKEHVAMADALTNAGITAAYFNVTFFEDYLDMLKVCTDITGRADLYEENGMITAAQIEEILDEVNADTAPEVLLMITFSGGVRVQTADTMTGRMLAELGCVNIADQHPSLLQDFSVEAVITADPDFIFVVPMGNDDELAIKNLEESVESNPAWSTLSAVASDRYILLPKERFLYKPNAAWNESYQYLFDLIYGE